MKLTKNDKLCQFFVKGGLCSHPDAPRPTHSRCISKIHCGVYEVEQYKKDNPLRD